MAEEKAYSEMNEAERNDYLIKRYNELTDNAAALDDLKSCIETRRQGYGEVWSTGFKKLDEKLDGGFMGEQLIFLGAVSSLGKTSYALEMATQIAEQGKDVLIFSLEMSKNELNAKTISRYTYLQTETGDEYKKAYRLTTREILSGKVGSFTLNIPDDGKARVFQSAFDATKKIAGHVRIFIGENDVTVEKIRVAVDTHIKMTKRNPFVLVDYLQILKPSTDEAETTDKRLLTDYDVTRLKVLSRDYHVPVLVISAFNRISYLEPVSMSSFKESSGIEYSSDILLAMQYDGMDYQKRWFTDANTGKRKRGFESTTDHNTRVRELLSNMDDAGTHGEALPIQLKILKNRNGCKGTLYYDFYPAYNHYAEKERLDLAYYKTRKREPDDETDAVSSVVSSENGVKVGKAVK